MIRVTLDAAAVGTGPDAALPPVSASFGPGAPTLLATEGGNRPTVLSLVASGRMRTTAGSVVGESIAADGSSRTLASSQLRRAVALIDTPLVAEHSDDVSVRTVIREESAYLRGRARSAASVRDAARQRSLFGSLSAEDRIRLLVELALQRPGVEALVVTSPERHGGDPAAWWRVLREVAARDIAVLVVTDHATVAHLSRLPHSELVRADAVPLF